MPPKPQAVTSPRRAARAGVRAGTAAKPKAAAKPRNRRSPSDLLADLKAEREEVAQKMGARLAKLDQRIANVEARYEKSIKLAELQSVGADELARQLAEAQKQQKLLRMALKVKK